MSRERLAGPLQPIQRSRICTGNFTLIWLRFISISEARPHCVGPHVRQECQIRLLCCRSSVFSHMANSGRTFFKPGQVQRVSRGRPRMQSKTSIRAVFRGSTKSEMAIRTDIETGKLGAIHIRTNWKIFIAVCDSYRGWNTAGVTQTARGKYIDTLCILAMVLQTINYLISWRCARVDVYSRKSITNFVKRSRQFYFHFR